MLNQTLGAILCEEELTQVAVDAGKGKSFGGGRGL